MERPSYLSKYLFDWELMDVVIGGRSALDSKFFIGPLFNTDQVNSFLQGYGVDPADPVNRAELFGNFQEALQFIKRYFLKEGTEDGLDLQIPNSLYRISDIGDIFLMATGNLEKITIEEQLWAEVILKVMHTILHVDKDIRSNYFSIIQTQIFDRFYKYVHRDGEDKLYLGDEDESGYRIPLVDFETKSKKTRDSVIIKLLHKAENVAEELFDRVGVRFITESRFDTLRVVKFLMEKNIIIPHNVKPSRSVNTIVDMTTFKEKHKNLLKMAMRNNLSEERFLQAMERDIHECMVTSDKNERNEHSSRKYRSMQFTCRQLIKYRNPFMTEFSELRKAAKKESKEESSCNDLAKKVMSLDTSLIARDIRFFYPFEVQIADLKTHQENSEGEASHDEYKKTQIQSARSRVFKALAEYKRIEL